MPISTSLFSTVSLPSLLIRTITYCLFASGSKAASGMTFARRVLRKRSTCIRMPGMMLPSGFDNIARTWTERVTGSTRLSMLLTSPRYSLLPSAAARALILSPGFSSARNIAGTEKSSLILLVSSKAAIRSPLSTSAPTLMLRKPTTPSNGARMTRSSILALVAVILASACASSRRVRSISSGAASLRSSSCSKRSSASFRSPCTACACLRLACSSA